MDLILCRMAALAIRGQRRLLRQFRLTFKQPGDHRAAGCCRLLPAAFVGSGLDEGDRVRGLADRAVHVAERPW